VKASVKYTAIPLAILFVGAICIWSWRCQNGYCDSCDDCCSCCCCCCCDDSCDDLCRDDRDRCASFCRNGNGGGGGSDSGDWVRGGGWGGGGANGGGGWGGGGANGGGGWGRGGANGGGGWGGGGANGGDDWSRGSANGGGVESDRIIPNPGPGHVENVVTIPRESRRNRDHPEPRILTPVTWKSRSVAE